MGQKRGVGLSQCFEVIGIEKLRCKAVRQGSGKELTCPRLVLIQYTRLWSKVAWTDTFICIPRALILLGGVGNE